MKRIGVLTSGGDAPGMNAAVRAVVRTGIYREMDVVGIRRGYEGLLEEDFFEMTPSDVGDILHRGGTILKTSRSQRFLTEEGQRQAAENLRKHQIDGVVTCGGDGTYRGALDLEKQGIAVAGVPCTIDNDMGYTERTIGFDTAVNTVLSAIGKIRDTGSAHGRTFVIEVMGRYCGDIALASGLAGGAESILIPEVEWDLAAVCDKIRSGMERGKTHSIIIKAEGVEMGTEELAERIGKATGEDVRTVTLAYLQRGGSPTAQDRMLASRMGERATELLACDMGGRAVGLDRGQIIDVSMEEAVETEREPDLDLLPLIDMLAI